MSASVAGAQGVPDGGTLRQQLDPPRTPSLPALTPRAKDASVPEAPPAGPRVVVRSFTFSGHTLLSEADLQAAVAPWLGRELGFAELGRAAQAVSQAYREGGWLARADLPPQDITSGVVRVQVTEARLSDNLVEGQAQRVKADQVQRIMDRAGTPGGPVNLDDLDRALLRVNDLAGISATLGLRSGQQSGETQAVMSLQDTPLWRGAVSVDNTGPRATGGVQSVGQLALQSPLRRGDQAQMQFSHSQGSDFLRLAYSAPVGSQGWRLGANATALKYRVITSEFSALEAQGPSQSTGVEASTALWRSRNANLYLQLSSDRKRFRNEAAGAVNSRYRIAAHGLSLSGNRLDREGNGGGGVTSGTLQWVSGRVDLSGSPNEAADAQTTHTAGRFDRLRMNASRQQRLSAQTTLVAQGQVQWARRNLDGSEKFYLGGINGVRAYPTNEGGGSSGRLLSMELQRTVPLQGLPPLTYSTFADVGQVTVNRDNDFTGAAALNTYTLKGVGVWAAVNLATPVGPSQLRVTWAHRVGRNPAANAAGRDQDGSRSLNRLWLSASVSF